MHLTGNAIQLHCIHLMRLSAGSSTRMPSVAGEAWEAIATAVSPNERFGRPSTRHGADF
jgi:hypothetical protein